MTVRAVGVKFSAAGSARGYTFDRDCTLTGFTTSAGTAYLSADPSALQSTEVTPTTNEFNYAHIAVATNQKFVPLNLKFSLGEKIYCGVSVAAQLSLFYDDNLPTE